MEGLSEQHLGMSLEWKGHFALQNQGFVICGFHFEEFRVQECTFTNVGMNPWASPKQHFTFETIHHRYDSFFQEDCTFFLLDTTPQLSSKHPSFHISANGDGCAILSHSSRAWFHGYGSPVALQRRNVGVIQEPRGPSCPPKNAIRSHEKSSCSFHQELTWPQNCGKVEYPPNQPLGSTCKFHPSPAWK